MTSANGAGACASSAVGISSIGTVDTVRYTTATNTVPTMVARGMVRPGSATFFAGTVADSKPSMANSAITPAVATPPAASGTVGACAVRVAGEENASQAPSAA